MKKLLSITAGCLAMIGATWCNALWAAGNSADELSQLAAELAEKAAQLEQMQASFEAKSTRSDSDTNTTTVRWLTEQDDNGSYVATDEDESVLLQRPIVNNVTHTTHAAPRPAALAYRSELSAIGNVSASRVVRAQASEEIYDVPTEEPTLSGVGPAPTDSAGEPTWQDPLYCGASGCCDACAQGFCDSCCGDGCCCQRCCRRPCTIVAGTEAVFLATDINGGRVNWRHDQFAPTPAFAQQFGPYWGDAALDDFYVAPRLWLGVQGCKWGIVGRYFHLRAGENDYQAFDPLASNPHYSFNANSIFEAYYTDLEVTRNFCLHGCKNQLSFGARYALLEHHESIYGRVVVDDGILEASARSNRQAHGTGLTFGLNGRKPLFPCSCAHWFYSARSSILWGCTHNDVETHAGVVANAGATAIAGTIDGARVALEDDLFIGEFQAGIQWDFALRCLPAKAFFRTAFEYQYWDASAGLAGSGSFAGVTSSTPGDNQVLARALAPGLIVDMYGLSVATGFTW